MTDELNHENDKDLSEIIYTEVTDQPERWKHP